MTGDAARWPEKAWIGWALFALVVLVYLPAIRGGFIWDDDSHLTENPCIIGPAGFAGIWTSSAAVYYPLTLTSFWGLHWLFGLNPIPYHIFNILMHAGCAVLLRRVLGKLRIPGAWLGAAIWTLHPVMAESVAWITELKNTQSGLFYLLTILWFLKIHTREENARFPWTHYVLSLALFVMAITSKSSTVMLPVVLALCAWWLDGRWRWKNAALLAPFFLLSALSGLWTVWEQKYHSGALGQEWTSTWQERIAVAGYDVWFYLGKLAWPHPLLFVYPRWRIDVSSIASFLPALAVIACLLLFGTMKKPAGRAMFFAFAYFVVSLFPVMDFFDVYFFRYSFVGDHFQYLASIGPLALAGAAISLLPTRLTTALGGILLIALAGLTWKHEAIFRDSKTLWADTLAKDPDCWMAHNNMGSLLDKEGKTDEAIAHYRTSLRIKPDSAAHHNNVGNLLLRQGHTDEAIAELHEALQLDPKLIDALNNLGNALLQQGNVDEALDHYSEAVRLNPKVVNSLNNLGVALVEKGRFEDAMVQYKAALAIKPDDARVHNNIGRWLEKQSRPREEAIAEYRTAVTSNPDYANAWSNLAKALEATHQMDVARECYAKAAALQPASAQAHYELGRMLLIPGRHAEALKEYRRALELSPDQPLTLNDIAWIQATSSDATLRNGVEALKLAVHCCDLTYYKTAMYLDTLAAACAELGKYDEAVKWAQAALDAADSAPLRQDIDRRLTLYKSGQPYRETATTGATPTE